MSYAFANTETSDCKIVVEANDQMRYNLDRFSINKKDCPEFTIELKHVGKLPVAAMGHNVVVSKTMDAQGILNDGIAAGLANGYVKSDDSRVIAATKLIGGGETMAITFKTDKLEVGGDYQFFCSFPGHYAMMKGKVEVIE